MAFSFIRDSNSWISTVGSGNATIAMPSFETGDLLVTLYHNQSWGNWDCPYSGDWTCTTPTPLDDGGQIGILTRLVDGTEGWTGDGTDTDSIEDISGGYMTTLCLAIKNPVSAAFAYNTNDYTTGNPNVHDPASVTFSTAGQNLVILAALAVSNTVNVDIWPSGYTQDDIDIVNTNGPSTIHMRTAVVDGTSEDPGSFTMDGVVNFDSVGSLTMAIPVFGGNVGGGFGGFGL